jgi:FeS assembly SUF system protein
MPPTPPTASGPPSPGLGNQPPAAGDFSPASGDLPPAAGDVAPAGDFARPMHQSSPDLSPEQRALEIKIVGAIRQIYDPEIPVNIYDLGLIYEIHIDAELRVDVKMTLTAPGCPVAGSLPAEVERKIETIPEVKSANVDLVWEPTWDKSRMSEAAMLDLGLM